MWVIVAVSADYRGFRPLQWSLPAVTPVTGSHGHTSVVLEITPLPQFSEHPGASFKVLHRALVTRVWYFGLLKICKELLVKLSR